MKIKPSIWLVAALAFVLGGCQSAKKPAASVAGKPQNSPPPITTPAQPAASARTAQPRTATAATPQAQNQKPEAKPDPVAELIARVESEYQAGLEKSGIGQDDAAKEHFDRA